MTEFSELERDLIAHQHQPQSFLGILDRHGCSLRGPSPSPGFPYSRTVLGCSPHCEVMLARWTPGIACAPHDHGQSSGWVLFLEGEFSETSYAWESQALRPGPARVFLAGSRVGVEPGEIHSCQCSSAGLSLHLYFPRIEGMRVYDIRGQRTLTVSDDCGAWIPPSRQIVRQHPWTPIAT